MIIIELGHSYSRKTVFLLFMLTKTNQHKGINVKKGKLEKNNKKFHRKQKKEIIKKIKYSSN